MSSSDGVHLVESLPAASGAVRTPALMEVPGGNSIACGKQNRGSHCQMIQAANPPL